MPTRKRKQREHTEDWQTIKQYTLWPELSMPTKNWLMHVFGETH